MDETNGRAIVSVLLRNFFCRRVLFPNIFDVCESWATANVDCGRDQTVDESEMVDHREKFCQFHGQLWTRKGAGKDGTLSMLSTGLAPIVHDSDFRIPGEL